jgi:hypothetical protein
MCDGEFNTDDFFNVWDVHGFVVVFELGGGESGFAGEECGYCVGHFWIFV